MTKHTLVTKARQLAGSLNAAGRCLDLAWWTCVVLGKAGYDVCFQAGSASWPLRPDWNRAEGITHVGFEWNAKSAGVFMSQMLGDADPDAIPLPEIHCWAGIAQTQEVIDLSTCFLPDICNNMNGHRYDMPVIDYIWENGRELADRGIVYRVDRDATLFAFSLMQTITSIERSPSEQGKARNTAQQTRT